jgi:hypothetical protein
MQDLHLEIPVYLVAEAPFPQAVTHRRRGGGGICFVGLSELKGLLLCETVLHEATHALDVATRDSGSVLVDLQERLRTAGFGPGTPAYRDVPHTVIFVQAGETVRRLLDSAHRHYGEVCGYYAKVPAAAEAVRAWWPPYLDGAIGHAEVVERIVQHFVQNPGP